MMPITLQVTAHEVQRVVPHPAPAAAVSVGPAAREQDPETCHDGPAPASGIQPAAGSPAAGGIEPAADGTAANGIQLAADGTAEIETVAPHPFSGANQLATLAGLPPGLKQHFPVTKSDQQDSQTKFRIKLLKARDRQREAKEAAVMQAAAAGNVTVRWEQVSGCSEVSDAENCCLRGGELEWPQTAAW